MSNIRPISEQLQVKAIAELNEVPSRLEEDIIALRTWIDKEPHLNARTDDQFLLTFLRGCKFSLEKAKEKIDKYYTFRTAYESILTCPNVEDPRVQECIKLGVFMILPNPLGEDGPKIMFMRAGHYPTSEYTYSDIMRSHIASQDIMLQEDDNFVISGYIQIADFSEITMAHFFQISPSMMKKMSTFAENALPIRHRGSHFINTPSAFESVFNTIKPFLSEKTQQRLYIHANIEELYKVIPQKYLPLEYGGENGSIQEIIDSQLECVLAHADYLKKNAQYGTDEKLRLGKPIDFENVFGVDGSFRKLNVD